MKKWWVHFISIVSCVLCLVWLVGLGWTFKDTFIRNTTTSTLTKPTELHVKETSKEDYHVVALGDSLTRGLGDTEGKGYVGYVIDRLSQETEQKIDLTNLAINGLTSGELVELVEQVEVQRQMKTADIILLTIGGNDLFQGGRTLLELNIEEIKPLEKQYIHHLNQILSSIRSVNSEATLYVSGLYNPFIQLENAELTSKIIMDWNHQTMTELVKDSKAIYVPTFDIFQQKVQDYLYGDQFHPNSIGYKQIGLRIASLITEVGEEK